MKENNNVKAIKQLTKEFRGMRERFKTQNQKDFASSVLLFEKALYRAYDINDIYLNEVVRKSYNEVYELLINRLVLKPTDSISEDIHRFLFIIKPVMCAFMQQAGRLYD